MPPTGQPGGVREEKGTIRIRELLLSGNRLSASTKQNDSRSFKGDATMKALLNRFMKDESGITALETAIILIAFVVVAAIFAFTVLSTGTFLTQKSQEAAYSGLQEVRGSMELKGSVLAQDLTATGHVTHIKFDLANVAGGQPIDLNDVDGSQVVKMTYRDSKQTVDLGAAGAPLWTVSFVGHSDGDLILDGQELAEIDVDVSGLTTKLGPNTTFDVEVQPPSGAVLQIERTTPAKIDAVTDLH
jgi:flagellin FlaB